MKTIYEHTEHLFEKLSMIAVRIFTSPVTFAGALVLVIYWLFHLDYRHTSLQDTIRDIIISITFLSFFIIQKWFNHFSRALHLKLNELVASHENADNQLIKAEEKSEAEMKELSKNHEELVAKTKEL